MEKILSPETNETRNHGAMHIALYQIFSRWTPAFEKMAILRRKVASYFPAQN